MSTAAQVWIDERHEQGVKPVGARAKGQHADRTSAAGRTRSRRSEPGPEQSGAAPEQPWNVLAELLVAYPPAHRRIFLDRAVADERGPAATSPPAAGVSYGEAWIEQERLRLRARTTLALSEPAGRLAPADNSERARREPLAAAGNDLRRAARTEHVLRGAPGSAPLARRCSGVRSATESRPLRRPAAVRPEPRGLRRLLPGVATLAALAGLWFGTGLLSGIHRPAYRVLPGSVRVARGYLYVARPGDTVWSIATAVQPGGDPRPLADRLEAELGGRTLQPGDRLLLP